MTLHHIYFCVNLQQMYKELLPVGKYDLSCSTSTLKVPVITRLNYKHCVKSHKYTIFLQILSKFNQFTHYKRRQTYFSFENLNRKILNTITYHKGVAFKLGFVIIIANTQNSLMNMINFVLKVLLAILEVGGKWLVCDYNFSRFYRLIYFQVRDITCYLEIATERSYRTRYEKVYWLLLIFTNKIIK